MTTWILRTLTGRRREGRREGETRSRIAALPVTERQQGTRTGGLPAKGAGKLGITMRRLAAKAHMSTLCSRLVAWPRPHMPTDGVPGSLVA